MSALAVRKCRCCGVEKAEEAFYASQRHKCKECIKQAVRDNRAANSDHYKAYDNARAQRPDRVELRLAYQRTEAFHESHRKACRKYWHNNPQRKLAHSVTSNAIRQGLLVREPCFCCGSTDVEAHHPDYSAPFSVVWLCVKHHKQLHHEHELLHA